MTAAAQALRDVATSATPYKFLDYFNEDETEDFAGRDDECAAVAALALRGRTLVVYGRSGLGKTSLLKAGVFPLLVQRGVRPVYVRLLAHPIEDLRRALIEAAAASGAALPDGAPLEAAAAAVARTSAVAIVLDQFEEFFTRFDGPTRGGFVEALQGLLEAKDLRLRVIFSLREEFIAGLDEFRAAIGEPLANTYRLLPLTPFGAREAILAPLRREGIAYDPRLITRLVKYLETKSFHPGVLQVVCALVYLAAARKAGGGPVVLREEHFESGDRDLFQEFVEAALRAIPAERRLVACAILDELTPGARTKQAVTVARLLEMPCVATEKEVQETLHVLRSERLVRELPKRGDEAWYELIHDIFAPIVGKVLDADIEYARFRAARETVANGLRMYGLTPDSVLPREHIDQTIGRLRERLRLASEEREYVLRCAILSGSSNVEGWAGTVGLDRARAIAGALLRDPRPATRAAAVKGIAALAASLPELFAEALRLSLEDEDKSVRWAAGRVWARSARPSDLPALAPALAGLGMPAAIDVLGDLIEAGRPVAAFGRIACWQADYRLRRRDPESMDAPFVERAQSGSLDGGLAALAWVIAIALPLLGLFASASGIPLDDLGATQVLLGGLPLVLFAVLVGRAIGRDQVVVAPPDGPPSNPTLPLSSWSFSLLACIVLVGTPEVFRLATSTWGHVAISLAAWFAGAGVVLGTASLGFASGMALANAGSGASRRWIAPWFAALGFPIAIPALAATASRAEVAPYGGLYLALFPALGASFLTFVCVSVHVRRPGPDAGAGARRRGYGLRRAAGWIGPLLSVTWFVFTWGIAWIPPLARDVIVDDSPTLETRPQADGWPSVRYWRLLTSTPTLVQVVPTSVAVIEIGDGAVFHRPSKPELVLLPQGTTTVYLRSKDRRARAEVIPEPLTRPDDVVDFDETPEVYYLAPVTYPRGATPSAEIRGKVQPGLAWTGDVQLQVATIKYADAAGGRIAAAASDRPHAVAPAIDGTWEDRIPIRPGPDRRDDAGGADFVVIVARFQRRPNAAPIDRTPDPKRAALEYLDAEDYESALSAALAAVAASPNDADAQNSLANAAFACREYERAGAAWAIVEKLNPDLLKKSLLKNDRRSPADMRLHIDRILEQQRRQQLIQEQMQQRMEQKMPPKIRR